MRKGRTVKISSAQNRLDSTLQAAKNATAPTVAKPVKAAHSTAAEIPMRSSTSSNALARISQRIRPLMGPSSSLGNWSYMLARRTSRRSRRGRSRAASRISRSCPPGTMIWSQSCTQAGKRSFKCCISSLSAQRREQDHVPDAGAVGQQHHQAIDADAAAPGGGHAIFERAHEVMVMEHGLFIAPVLGGHWGVKACGLLLGVVQFAEAVAEFAAGDVQLKALRDLGAQVVGARQRRDLGGVLHDEGRLPQLVFHRLFKVQQLQAEERGA